MHIQRGENPLTVGDLLAALSDVFSDTIVVMSSDSEGNNYSPLAEGDLALYGPESTWSGQLYPTQAEIDAPDSPYDPEEDQAPDDAYEVFCLWPTN